MTFEHTIGTRAQVWHGTAKKTSGGLTKNALMMNKHGRIVSRKKHASAKREKRLVKAGFLTKKGHFGFIKKGSKKMKGGAAPHMASHHMGSHQSSHHMMAKKGGAHMASHHMGSHQSGHHMMAKKGGRGHTMKMRGGMALGGPLSPHSFDGQGVGTSGVNLQFVAGNSA